MASADYPVLDRPEDETSSVLASLGLSPATRGTGGAPLTIPLDVALPIRKAVRRGTPTATSAIASFGPDADAFDALEADGDAPQTTPRRLPVVKRKEGSRQRRRWENDRLMHVPNVQPPLPSDWEVHPTHPVHNHVPYHIAHVWDKGLRRHVNETRAAAAVLRRQQFVAQQAGVAGTGAAAGGADAAAPLLGLVTRELRAAAKKVPAVKTWVRVLEEPIRDFALRAAAAPTAAPDGNEKESSSAKEASATAADTDDADDTDGTDDTEDTTDYGHARASTAAPPSVSCFSGDEDDGEDEIVFVGRRPAAATATDTADPLGGREGAGIVLGSLPGDDGGNGSFQRWLIHSVSEYYGLVSQSATLGMPPRRAVYVTQRDEAARPGCGPAVVPRPMWELF